MTGRSSRVGLRWQKAPLVLRWHPSVLVAVWVAALLVGLAAASSPFVRSAAGSVALRNKLDEFTPFSTGLQISGIDVVRSSRSVEGWLDDASTRRRAVARLGESIGFVRPPVTTLLAADAELASSASGFAQVRLIARDGALAHVRVLSRVGGDGVWLSDLAAKGLHVKAGGRFRLTPPSFSGGGRPVPLRVKGIYRTLAYEPERPYWNNFFADIYPGDLDSPPPPSFAFVTRRELFSVERRLGGEPLEYSFELPVDPAGLTLDRARALSQRFAAVKRTLSGRRQTALSRKLRCPLQQSGFGQRRGCEVSSSLPAAITIADANVSAVSPIVRLLATLGGGIALAVAAAAGVFMVRRRRVEAALAFSRGEHPAGFAALTAAEALLPMLAGGAAGFGLAFVLTDLFAPSGTVNATTFRAGAWQAAAAVVVGLALLTATATLAFLRLYDTGVRGRKLPRWLVWELPLLAVAVYLLVDLERGGGLAQSGSSGSQHPTLAVFVFPLLLAAGVAGLAARLARILLGRTRNRLDGAPVAAFLAARRLAAARGLLVVLAVVSAVSFGGFIYAEALAASLAQTTDEKAYTANGSDVAAIVSEADPLPPRFRYPITKVTIGSGAAAGNSAIGDKLDVLLVDPRALPDVLHWRADWGRNPSRLLDELAAAPSSPLPVIAAGAAPPLRALSLAGTRFPVRLLGSVRAFPGMSQNPMVITSYTALAEAARQHHQPDPLDVTLTYVWAKGPPDDVSAALAASSMQTYFAQTVDHFRRDPDVLLATRTYSYLRAIAITAGALALIGLLLYLQARQRSQLIASALGKRMGLAPLAEALSLSLEVAALALFASVIGAVVALAAARPVVTKIDPLPDWAPPPVFAVPTAALLVAAAALLLVAVAAGLITSWLARRADISEAIRVA